MNFTEADIGIELNEGQKENWFKIAKMAFKESESKEKAIKQADKLSSKIHKNISENGLEMAMDILKEASKKYKGEPKETLDEALKAIEEITATESQISFDGGESWLDFREAVDLSMEEIKEKIKTKLKNDLAPTNVYPWVTETHSDYVIVEIDREGGESGYYQYDYEVNDDGDIELSEPIQVDRVVTWEPVEEMTESLKEFEIENEAVVSLVESESGKVLGDDGTTDIKIIEPGWGESAYYPEKTLEESAGVFEGAKMYWNHPTAKEEKERPEGDLNNLAGIIESKPEYQKDGPKGEGVYAKAKVFGPYQEAVEGMAPHIGLSIRAGGKAKRGKAEGKEGKIAEAITHSKSVDFVTEPAAGGEIIELFESVGRKAAEEKNTNYKEGDEEVKFEELTIEELREARPDLVEKLEVQESQEDGENEDNDEQLVEAQRKIDKLEEKLMLREASSVIKDQLSQVKLPNKTKERLFNEAITDVPTGEDGELDKEKLSESINDSVEEAQAELKEAIGSTRISGMGESGSEDDSEDFDEAKKELEKEFQESLGLDEKGAKRAVEGR